MPDGDLPLPDLQHPTGSRPFRWGIVGFGWVARDFALPAMRDAGHSCVAVHDPGPHAAARAEAEGVRHHPDLSAMLAEPDLDAVYVATPNHAHPEAVAACAAAGIPVLCEK
ncbi:MAG: Gfo/Idh/MocA family oxidoreductase, partial [Gluconacetobacter diazotrophicus]|nr:Gfo/Idh/MocA family oxidoreductase [Gluconacetobacter diazotrophicus]